MYDRLNSMIDDFKQKNKDVVFLVNEKIKHRGAKLETKVKKTLEIILDEHIGKSDRVALLSYSNNVKKLINLVGTNKNKT